jgi:hypothetical protein
VKKLVWPGINQIRRGDKLKKQLLIISALLSLLLGSSGRFDVAAASATGPDDTVIASLLQNTYTTTKLFTGGNENWDCTLKVVDTVAANSTKPGNTGRMQFVLTPLVLSKYYTRYFEYSVWTSRGNFSGAQWFKAGDSIQIEANTPIPSACESIMVKICDWCKEEVFYLTNVISSNAISPEQALRKAFEVYYATYGAYPTAKFTFAIDFIDKTDWLITFDDNDGIGGQGHLLINAITGETCDIKEDEG